MSTTAVKPKKTSKKAAPKKPVAPKKGGKKPKNEAAPELKTTPTIPQIVENVVPAPEVAAPVAVSVPVQSKRGRKPTIVFPDGPFVVSELAEAMGVSKPAVYAALKKRKHEVVEMIKSGGKGRPTAVLRLVGEDFVQEAA